MLALRLREFLKKLLQAFGIVKIREGSMPYSFNCFAPDENGVYPEGILE